MSENPLLKKLLAQAANKAPAAKTAPAPVVAEPSKVETPVPVSSGPRMPDFMKKLQAPTIPKAVAIGSDVTIPETKLINPFERMQPADVSDVDPANWLEQTDDIPPEVLQEFLRCVSYVVNSFGSSGTALSEALVQTRQILNSNRNLAQNIKPEGIQQIVRGLRESYGMVATVKNENKNKRTASRQIADDMVSFLDTLKI